MSGILAVCILAVTPNLPVSMAGTDDVFAVFANPAGLGVRSASEFSYISNHRPRPGPDFLYRNTFAMKLGGLAGFWDLKPSRWGVALGLGGSGFYSGLRYGRDSAGHQWDMGAMARPFRWLSLGATWVDFARDWGRVGVGAAVRPVGKRLTLFGETELTKRPVGTVGLEAEPVDGLRLAGRFLVMRNLGESEFTLGASIGFGRAGVGIVGTRRPAELAGYVRAGSEMHGNVLPRPKSALELRLAESISDQEPGFSLAMRPSRTTWDLLELLKHCRDDKSVKVVLLELDGAAMGLAQAGELRAAIKDCGSHGKRVYAYSDWYGMGSYYIASACDRVICHEQGGVEIPGVSATMPFLKGTLEKIGVKVNYTRRGKYKSAVEVFSEDSMSRPNREQYEALLDDIYDDMTGAIAEGRGLSRDNVDALVGRAWFLAAEAQRSGLVDTFCYRDELDSILKKELKGLRRVSEGRFTAGFGSEPEWVAGPAVAIIYASGSIRSGESGTDFLSGSQSMGANTMARAIRSARDNKRVKAIVLRIDSPGGDGFAADVIWHELELARKKKPVVVSMGGVAGSGGYYIACNANRVFASPTTLTGSIGVFSLKLVTEGLYNKLGARRQTIRRGEHADANSDAREYTPEEDSAIQEIADSFYWQFVRKVAQGRGMTVERVDSVGQGRVWSGRDAQANGLVDSLGGFTEAVEYAKKEARLKECDFLFYPKPRTDLLSRLGTFVRTQILNTIYE